MYLHKENKDGDSGLRRMKNAVWVDLVNMILWFIVMLASAAYWFKNRDKRSQWTGRARV